MSRKQQLLQEEGFLIVREGVLSSQEVQRALEEISAIIHGRVPYAEKIMVQVEPAVQKGIREAPSREWAVRKLMSYVPHSPILTEIARHPKIAALLRELLAEDVKLLQDMAMLKPPQVGSPKTWHQDCAYFPIEPPRVLGFWIALDQATRENGCMEVIPGTHREPIPHETIVEDAFPDYGIPKDHPVFQRTAVAVELEPGDALVFDGLLVHGTGPNRSDRPRRALQLHYVNARCRYTGRNRPPELLQIIGRSYEGCV
ncbi:MAG: hypothetical protein KatS3mg115_1750 [Candidatus Poribacteria bacterium]|nr:MAG: hypothetical protein KatS3mg115_1750 [Candidatus Poribacteria bacterium]